VYSLNILKRSLGRSKVENIKICTTQKKLKQEYTIKQTKLLDSRNKQQLLFLHMGLKSALATKVILIRWWFSLYLY